MEKKLNSYSQQNNLPKSTIVKEALAMYFKKEESAQSAYELGSDLFGSGASGNTDGSTSYKSKLKQKIGEKHSH